MKIDEVIVLGGRRYRVVGFDPLGVAPRRVYLRDLATGDEVSVEQDELRDSRPEADAGCAGEDYTRRGTP